MLNRASLLYLGGATLSWSVAGIFVHALSPHVGILTQSVFRYFSASIALFAISALFFPGEIARAARQWRSAALAALCCTLFQLAWVKALYLIKPGTVILLGELGTAVNIVVLSLFYADERRIARTPLFLWSTALSLAGVGGFIFFSPRLDFNFNAGVILIVLSTVAWGLYTVSVKRVLKVVNPVAVMAWIALAVALYHALFAAAAHAPLNPARFPAKIAGLLFLSGVVSIAVSHSCYYFAVGALGAVVTNNFLLVTPILTCVFSYFAFGERFSASQTAFAAVLMAGVYMTGKVRPSPPAPLPETGTGSQKKGE